MNKLTYISEEEFERIERYHLGSLNAEEKIQFEKEISANDNFAAKVTEVLQLIRGVETATLKGKLNEFHNQLPQSEEERKSGGTKSRTIVYAIAAILIVLFGIFWFFNATSDSEKLFAKHFTPDPGLPTTMSSNTNYEFYDGMVNYKQDDFETALKKWTPLLQRRPQNDTLNYFIGVAYLANGNTKEAVTQLEKLYQSNPQSFKNETAYYLGLAYLRVENLEKAKKYLIFSNTKSAQEVLLDID